jgi:Xaa-Pro aminopeptidase
MNSDFFIQNRSALVRAVQGGVIVASAYSAMQSSGDMAAPFLQEANFLYLTGIREPDWMLIIDGSQSKSWLVMPTVDDVHRVFNGGIDAEDARRISGVKTIITADEAMKLLRTLARTHTVAYTTEQPAHADDYDFVLNPSFKRTKHMLERLFTNVQSCQRELTTLRAIKQPVEIEAIKSAISHTAKAFSKVKANMNSYRYEYEIEAEFTYLFRKNGSEGHAYDPIVASGVNACTLHYSVNESKLSSRQLVLMDIGARANGYAADITRTYAKGEPTKRQRDVHQAVERAHYEIIDLIEHGIPVEQYQRNVMRIMERELVGLKLMKAGDEKALRRYFPHAVSHGLGIDVHDSLGAPRTLQTSMVLTVEPGIYIPEEGIGVRIEDDILITESGRKNLSATISTGL